MERGVLSSPHLEGVITLPNDTEKWGPWAGKLLTGDEDYFPAPVIYAIDPSGVVQLFQTTNLIAGGIYPEDFDIIPPNQSLYACDPSGMIVKLPANVFTNYVGDLLITDAGEVAPPAKLFILHWNAAATNFSVSRITYQLTNGVQGSLEHVTFAPIEIPPP